MFAICPSARLLSLAAFLFTCVGVSADEDLVEKRVELKKDDRIIFFGDSLTALAGQQALKEHVTKGFVRVVRETLPGLPAPAARNTRRAASCGRPR